jgi:hypothetical protein
MILTVHWYALTLCILNPNFTPEAAFNYFEHDRPMKRKDITVQDVADMVKMRETMTYEQIGKIYGVSKHVIFKRVKRIKQ